MLQTLSCFGRLLKGALMLQGLVWTATYAAGVHQSNILMVRDIVLDGHVMLAEMRFHFVCCCFLYLITMRERKGQHECDLMRLDLDLQFGRNCDFVTNSRE